jgi:hypothetical protein
MSDEESHLREFLADRDELCPRCRYNLRGLTTSSCPECGEVLRLQTLRERPRVRKSAWVVVGIWTQLGSCVLLWTLIDLATVGSADGQAGFDYVIPLGLAGLLALWGMVWFALVWAATPERRVLRTTLTLLLWCLVALTTSVNALCFRAIILHRPW